MRLAFGFAWLARRHPGASAAAVAALAVAVRLVLLPVMPAPVPLIPDEHAYLLLAQTLAAGRLANPPHPMWEHFETLFVLHRPAYAAVYPPVQGALLALGATIFGHPWAGVLAGIAGMIAATWWMLRGWVSRLWALYGALLAAAGLGVFGYWANSYWGGAGAAIGGALVFGALPRVGAGRRRDAAILGVGLVVLANARPFEGLLAAVPAAAWLLWRRKPRGPGAAVLAGVLLAGAAFTGWYWWRVTGSPFRPPHVAYMRQYAAAPAFVWQGAREAPQYRDRVLREAHLSFGIDYAEYATAAGAARRSFFKVARLAWFYWGPLWVLVALAAPELLRDRRLRVPLLSLAACTAGILATVGFQPHYAAPCTAVFVLLLVEALRRVRRARRVGSVLVLAAPLIWTGAQIAEWRAPRPPNSLRARPAVASSVAAHPGSHLALVRYGPLHPLGEEWVYNEPDIDGARIVWARDLGEDANRWLMRYFRTRTCWLVEPDGPAPPRVQIFRAGSSY